MSFDLNFALATLQTILSALSTTIWVSIVSSLGAAVLGFLWEILRRTSMPLGWVMQVMIDSIRSTPLLVQIYTLYFVFPYYGVTLPALAVGIIALSVYYSGYLAEIFKAGIDAIDPGQFDAAKALGIGRITTIFLIVAPQMLRNIAAPMGNYFISLLKATPYLAVIAVPEMFGSALDVASDTFRYAEPMLAAGLIFLLLSVSIAQLVKMLEQRLLARGKR
ncbi:polar amino acid transport system permease protein [Bosea sp. CRIB-10]|uniref:amino acid ABC transporter permease n=1 Tax=Bosea sp. CRIB-10 TaxID=378404 RepID=UPI0008F40874|nr:amino acid ABC transporter permease [Bosea sp. CRIB-10]SFD63454.1 polar amino acid transport system permease protein [Bosea sp. CRIB-10]